MILKKDNLKLGLVLGLIGPCLDWWSSILLNFPVFRLEIF